jgi:protein-ribulosamine 3-kinase
MMSGEFTSMSTMYAAKPDLVPRPIAWGTYASIPDVHFFLCDFHDMTDELPDLQSFPMKMAELHRNGTSPNGKYGFPVTTYHGNTPLDHGWADTWEEYFTTRTKALLLLEQEAQGANDDIQALAGPFFAKVVPRLLRPLETGDRTIKPCLVHGDLWYGNATMDSETDLPIIFDAACFYAHNECVYIVFSGY